MLYSAVMFATGILFLSLGAAIYKGHTGLIHDYHQKNIAPGDLPAYGRAFSAGMFTMSGSFILSGIIALFGESKATVLSSVGITAAGIVVSLVIFAMVQKKYNGGFF